MDRGRTPFPVDGRVGLHGFLRLRCAECGHDRLLAFSCKRRGFCPSCGARRMSQTAAHLVDHVIPHVPVRQWVLSLPIPLRVLLAAQPELVTPVLQVVQRVVTRHLLTAAGLVADEGHGGAVTLIQRFGSAANLNIHLRCLVLDGVYRCHADGAPSFVEAGAPTDEELHALLQTVIARLMKMLTRRGVLVEDMGQTYLAVPDADGEGARTLRPLQAAAITYRIAFGPRAGQKVLTVRGAMPREGAARQPLCADIDGFSLHAAVRVEAHDRKRLEQLCRYITRPALSDARVQLNAAGQVESQAQDTVARRHHAPGDEPAGVHAAAGGAGAEAAVASDQVPWCAGTEREAAGAGGAASTRGARASQRSSRCRRL
ncbi:MAG: transposase [Burkholderiales bacterium]|nr:transposase [Burkholderiales bacterium]